MRLPHKGISLVEILISLAIFSTAMVGMYMSMNSVNASLAESMKRDIEASYANMLMSEVNPYSLLVESAYDKDSNDCSGVRCSITTTDGNRIYYTRLVDSAATTADIKRINVYLYRSPSGGTPYRKYRREIALKQVGYMARCNTDPQKPVKDPSGMIWIPLPNTPAASLTAGSYAPGSTYVTNCGAVGTNIMDGQMTYKDSSGTNQSFHEPWDNGHVDNVTYQDPSYYFPASAGQKYAVHIGFYEHDALNHPIGVGDRTLKVRINNTDMETVAIGITAGDYYKPFYKTYTATPITVSGVSVIKLELLSVYGLIDFKNVIIERL